MWRALTLSNEIRGNSKITKPGKEKKCRAPNIAGTSGNIFEAKQGQNQPDLKGCLTKPIIAEDKAANNRQRCRFMQSTPGQVCRIIIMMYSALHLQRPFLLKGVLSVKNECNAKWLQLLNIKIN